MRTAALPRAGSPLIAVGNEIMKGLRHGWAERTQILIELPLFTSFMLMLGFIVGQGERILAGPTTLSIDSNRAAWLFLGFSVYMYIYLLIQKMFWRMLTEIQTGTIEQTYLSPLPSWVHTIVGRAISAVIEAGLVVSVMYVVTNIVFQLGLTWRLDALIPMAFVLVGAVGFGLVIAGLILVLKRVEMFNDLVLLFLMIASGAVIAVDRLPAVLQAISPFVFLTHPVAAIRRIMLDDRSLTFLGAGGYLWLTVSAVGWLVAGFVIFRGCENIAKRAGSLGRY